MSPAIPPPRVLDSCRLIAPRGASAGIASWVAAGGTVYASGQAGFFDEGND